MSLVKKQRKMTDDENNENVVDTGDVNGEENVIDYDVSKKYWATQPATVDGMLGGFESISDIDIEQSQAFLNSFLNTNSRNKNKIGNKLAVDCGAGIGRISKHLLLKNFDQVEMVEVTENFVSKAKEYLGHEDSKRVAKFHCCGLQDFNPEPKKYDCIWIQWVAGYLSDPDFVEFLKRCKQALRSPQSSICILKENVTTSEYEFDEEDSSYTRPRQAYLNMIHKAGMRLIKDERQRQFPSALYEVRLFAFK